MSAGLDLFFLFLFLFLLLESGVDLVVEGVGLLLEVLLSPLDAEATIVGGLAFHFSSNAFSCGPNSFSSTSNGCARFIKETRYSYNCATYLKI